jgi:hypothetical protein
MSESLGLLQYFNDHMPAGMTAEETCLELYRRFRQQPDSFALEANE